MKDVNQVVDNTLDSLNKARTARPVAGASRKGNNPVLFLIGNSTMRTGTLGNGNNGQWGWGYYAGDYFDSNRITGCHLFRGSRKCIRIQPKPVRATMKNRRFYPGESVCVLLCRRCYSLLHASKYSQDGNDFSS